VVIRLNFGLDNWGSFPSKGSDGIFSLHHRVQTGSGAHPASYPMGTGRSFSGVKQLGYEADHSPPSSAEVKNVWNDTSIPQYVFMAWCLVKHGDNFTLPLLNWS
jgi:hypothetical protein